MPPDEEIPGTPPVIVVPAAPVEPEPPEGEEIDALAEMTAQESILCEERHEEVLETLQGMAERVQSQLQAVQQRLESQPPESPLLLQLQNQQAAMLEQLANLNRRLDSLSQTPPPSPPLTEPPTPPEPPAEPGNAEAMPESREPAAAPKRRRVRVV